MRRYACPLAFLTLFACGGSPKPAPSSPPPRVEVPAETHAEACTFSISDGELRAQDGAKVLDDLAARIRLAPADEALRKPKSIQDVSAILRRDTLYLFPAAASFARSLDTKDAHVAEATTELLMGEAQLLAAQVLYTQAAWVAPELRVARATLATEGGPPSTDRTRLLAQLLHLVDDGNAIAAALGATAPTHIARGADVTRTVQKEAPNDVRTHALLAEYHRLRGEWPAFEEDMRRAESLTREDKTSLRYLRGMEQLERFHDREQAAAMMRDALKAFPKFVRAQAALVLLAPDPKTALRELGRLRAMNEDHYLVMLLQPTLTADQELQNLRDADAPR